MSGNSAEDLSLGLPIENGGATWHDITATELFHIYPLIVFLIERYFFLIECYFRRPPLGHQGFTLTFTSVHIVALGNSLS
jgi:hypothetical protein